MSILSVVTSLLFVGQSLVGPDLAQLVEAGLRRMDQQAAVSSQILDGASLSANWDGSASAPVDGRALLASGISTLILTEAMPLAPQLNQTAAAVAQWGTAARRVTPATQVYLMESWHSLNSGPGQPVEGDPNAGLNWRARLDADLPIWEGIVREASAELGGDPVRLIPAGQAMAQLSDAIDAGQVPGLTSIQDVFADDLHPNGKGRYYLAMVQLAAITGSSPEGLPAMLTRSWPSRDAVIADDLAPVLQQLAWAAVSGYEPAPAAAAPDPAPQPIAIAAAALPDGLTKITNPNLGFNLNGVNDWTVEQPFLDVMKTARPWVGHLPGQWGGWDESMLRDQGWLDPDGWPKSIPPELTGLSTLVLTDLPPDAGGAAGRYLLSYDGKAEIKLDGLAQDVSAEPGRITFDFAPGPGAVIITLSAIDPDDPIHNMRLVRQDRADLMAQGQLFNPDFLQRLRGTRLLRFMDWMATNNATLSRAQDRPKPADYSWARNGVPMEVMVALANELDADAWFTVSHPAEDGLVQVEAELARDGLEPGRKAWVEYSNEVWNWQFSQAQWADEQAKARWGQDDAWVQFYALRATEVADIWAAAFGDAAKTRLVRVISSQTGWPGLETQILDAPLVIAEGRPAPWTHFDAFAVTGYFSANLGGGAKAPIVREWLIESEDDARKQAARNGLTGAEAVAYVETHRFDLATQRAAADLRDGSATGDPGESLAALLSETLPHFAQVAATKGLRLVMYEGGSHVVGTGAAVDDETLTEFFNHLNYTPEMGALYRDLLAGWANLTDAPFNAFSDVYAPGKWGSWGALRHLGDDNPRWQAIVTAP